MQGSHLDSYMTTLELVKDVDSKTKDIVNGFLRRIQLLLPSDIYDIYHDNIPDLISYFCILYFYIREYFGGS